MTGRDDNPLLQRYAGYAPVYDRRWARYTQATLRHALQVAPIARARSLLDVACGTGAFVSMALKVNPQLRVTGVDLSPQMLERAKQRIPAVEGAGIRWEIGRAESLPVESGSCDLLTCHNAFHLVKDQPEALREFHRALEHGGTLAIVDWCDDFLTIRLLRAWLNATQKLRRRVLRLAAMESMVRAAGFEVQRAEQFKASLFWGMMCVVAIKA